MLGSITVADRTWPVRLVRGRLFLDRGACPGFIDVESGNVLVSDLASDRQIMHAIGGAFVGLIEYWFERNTPVLATFKSPPGIDENETLPDLDARRRRSTAATDRINSRRKKAFLAALFSAATSQRQARRTPRACFSITKRI